MKRPAFPNAAQWALVLLFGVLIPVDGYWKEPEPLLVLKDPAPEIRSMLSYRVHPYNFRLQAMTWDGNFVFANDVNRPTAITVLTQTGDLVRHINMPTPNEEYMDYPGWPSFVWVLGATGNLLVKCARSRPYWMVLDSKGRLMTTFTNPASEGNVHIYPDGRFVIWTADRGTPRLPYFTEGQGMLLRCTYLLYDTEGNLIEVLNKPPDELGMGTQASGLAPFAFCFPKNAYLYSSRRPLDLWPIVLSNPARMTGGGFSEFNGSKFITSTPAVFDKEGRLIGYSDGCGTIQRNNLGEKALACSRDKAMDQKRNLYFAVGGDTLPYTIYKQEWVDGPGEPVQSMGFSGQYPIPSDLPKTIALDGFFRPMDVSPLSTNTYSLTAETGQTIKFEFKEDKLLMGKRPFPVYDLLYYGLALYQKQNPLAILGAIPEKWRERPAQSKVFLDFSQMDKGWIRFQGWERGDSKGHTTFTLKMFSLEAKPNSVSNTALPGYDEVRYIDRKEHEEIVLYFLEGQRITFHPDRPDSLIAFYPGVDKNTALFETGADTRVFIPAALQNRVSLNPKTLDQKAPASLQVYCVQWPLGPSTLELKETEMGSRRFASRDGKIIYELAFVLDEQKNPVAQPNAETLNYLYFFITDPSLKLDRAPQIMYETGVDTGEYHSWYEVRPEDVNPPVFEKKKTGPGSDMVYPGNSGEWIAKPWHQVEKELPLAQFTVTVSGEVAPGSILRVTFDEPGKGTQHHDIPLQKQTGGTWKTIIPLLCFTADGLDIGGTWRETENLATPQIMGVLTFRDKNVKWEVVGQ